MEHGTEQGNFVVACIVVHRLHSKYMRKQMVGISPLVLQAGEPLVKRKGDAIKDISSMQKTKAPAPVLCLFVCFFLLKGKSLTTVNIYPSTLPLL